MREWQSFISCWYQQLLILAHKMIWLLALYMQFKSSIVFIIERSILYFVFLLRKGENYYGCKFKRKKFSDTYGPVSYTHLRAHETRHDLVCRLLLEKKKKKKKKKK